MNAAAITAATVLAAATIAGMPNMGTGAVEIPTSANTTDRSVQLEHNLRRELRTARAQLSALAVAGTYPVDDQRLRSDLSQVASVALKWLERVDDADAKGVAAD